MTQEQQYQEKKEIPVDLLPDFMPIWTEIFHMLREKNGDIFLMYKLEEERNVSYKDGSKCLIGEANGEKRTYPCDFCSRMSVKPSMHVMLHGSEKSFYNFKQTMYDHVKKNHI